MQSREGLEVVSLVLQGIPGRQYRLQTICWGGVKYLVSSIELLHAILFIWQERCSSFVESFFFLLRKYHFVLLWFSSALCNPPLLFFYSLLMVWLRWIRLPVLYLCLGIHTRHPLCHTYASLSWSNQSLYPTVCCTFCIYIFHRHTYSYYDRLQSNQIFYPILQRSVGVISSRVISFALHFLQRISQCKYRQDKAWNWTEIYRNIESEKQNPVHCRTVWHLPNHSPKFFTCSSVSPLWFPLAPRTTGLAELITGDCATNKPALIDLPRSRWDKPCPSVVLSSPCHGQSPVFGIPSNYAWFERWFLFCSSAFWYHRIRPMERLQSAMHIHWLCNK